MMYNMIYIYIYSFICIFHDIDYSVFIVCFRM